MIMTWALGDSAAAHLFESDRLQLDARAMFKQLAIVVRLGDGF